MENLQIFKNEEFGEIRTVTINNEPWFVGKDIAEVLGYSNTRDSLVRHVDTEDKAGVAIHDGRQEREMVAINESGLYSLILSSKLPNAKKFKRWVTSDVLPSIRKHGMYATDELLNNPELAIKTFQALRDEREKNKALTADNKRMKPKEIFADAVSSSATSILIGDLAKLIRQNGVSIGQNRLFAWMREKGYLIKSGNSRNMPTQRYLDQGLFEVKESNFQNPDGSVQITRTTKVTGKGQVYFINKFLDQ